MAFDSAIDALVVRTQFHDYLRGDIISDPTEVANILASEDALHVVRTEILDALIP